MRSLSALLFALALPAFAQTPPTAASVAAPAASGDAFSRLDADKDGRVSSTEADRDRGFSASFAAMDANADGFVTRDEHTARARANAQPVPQH
jgi:Ca2+-binding EF-hand superfamily protein